MVQEAWTTCGDVFDTEAARRHFAESLTGVMVAENQTMRDINRECALTTAKACSHRWLTKVPWEFTVLNDQRLAWLPQALCAYAGDA